MRISVSLRGCLLLVMCLFAFSTQAQLGSKIVSQSDSELLNRIYSRLLEVLNTDPKTAPKLHITLRTLAIGSYCDSTGMIELESRAIAVCNQYPPIQKEVALAYLLGHELTHYYQKHNWGLEKYSTQILATNLSDSQVAANEAEADKYGMFLVYLSGYDFKTIYNTVPTLIHTLYQSYQDYEGNSNTVSSLPLRDSIVNEVKPLVREMVNIYKAADLLYASGNALEAFYTYDLLLNYIQLPEIYNNRGVAAFQSAYDNLLLTKRSPHEINFHYPMALNPDFMLEEYRNLTTTGLLNEAIKSFEWVLAKNPQDAYSHLHLAACYDLKNDPSNATSHLLNVGDFNKNPDFPAQNLVMKGIIAAHHENAALAKDYFDNALIMARKDSPLRGLIEQNIAFLKQGSVLIPLTDNGSEKEELAGLNIRKLYRGKFNPSFKLSNKANLSILDRDNSTLIQYESRNKIIQLHYTESNYHTTNKQIGVGSYYTKITDAYADLTHRTLLHQRGYYLIYPAVGLIFQLNQQGFVERWGVYDAN